MTDHIWIGVLQIAIIGFVGVMLVDFVDRKFDEKNLKKILKKQHP